MYHLHRLGIATICLLSLVLVLTVLPAVLNPTPPSREDRQRDRQWVSTSPYWLDRQACRWFMLCGVHHVRWDGPVLSRDNSTDDDDGGGELKRVVDLRRRSGAADERPNIQAWTSTRRRVQDRTTRRDDNARSEARDIPDYVLRYAPLVHLYSGEYFWPSDIADFVKHMDPFRAGAAVNLSQPLDLDNLGDLEGDEPEEEEEEVYLTSEVDVETRPAWLHSYRNTPVPFDNGSDHDEPEHRQEHNPHGKSTAYSPPVPLDTTTWWSVDRNHPIHRISDPRKVTPRRRRERRRLSSREGQQPLESPVAMHRPDAGGYSRAPAVLVMVDKGSGVLDAFWFFFYSYNLGQTVGRVRFGNHVGDWEHAMVRFENGVPRALFCSEHAGGKAYLWSALEKRRVNVTMKGRGDDDDEEKEKEEVEEVERPVLYSAVGSHAMYADAGEHPYVLPLGLLRDVTDRGPLWDPSRNTYAYFYDYEADARNARNATENDSLVPAASNPDAPTGWFHFAGPWGDETYPLADRRQWRLFGQYHYITGPQGPKFKKLDREKVCQTERCTIVTSIEAGRKMTWYG